MDHQMVHPGLLQQRSFLFQRIEQAQSVVVWMQDGSRMWSKGEQDGFRPAGFRPFLKTAQYSSVACMHSIERSDGQNGAFDA